MQRSWTPGVDVAAIYNGLGETEHALEWLERAFEAREFDTLFLKTDPRLQNLLSLPRMQRLLFG